MEQNIYMTTGELAKLMGITKETLFHYDEIGLFRPAVVMKNGYRYYEVSQMELLDAILLLKELRMPLKEIQELLGKRSPETLHAENSLKYGKRELSFSINTVN